MEMTFDGKATRSWGLDLQSCAITSPLRKEFLVDVPGGDGQIDLCEGMFPARYEMRTLTAVFKPLWNDVRQLVTALVNALEGRMVNIGLPDDSGHYMTGRIHISSAGCKSGCEITITALCMPWRYAVQEIVIQIPESADDVQYTWYNTGTRDAVPTVIVMGEVLITFGASSMALSPGTYQLAPLTIQGNDSITVSIRGGPAEVRYREAIL